MKILNIALYFCLKKDHHKDMQNSENDYEYIRGYCESIINTKSKAVIMYDKLSTIFLKKHSNDNITFYSPNNRYENMLIHDERFFYFLDYIKRDNNKYYMVSDISDVEILNPIYNNIDIDDDTIYICMENEFIMCNEWFRRHHFESYLKERINKVMTNYEIIFREKMICNCGVIFGSKKIMIELLEKMCEKIMEFYDGYTIKMPVDMLVINYVIYKYFNDKLYRGTNFCTPFAQNIRDKKYCVKHK